MTPALQENLRGFAVFHTDRWSRALNCHRRLGARRRLEFRSGRAAPGRAGRHPGRRHLKVRKLLAGGRDYGPSRGVGRNAQAFEARTFRGVHANTSQEFRGIQPVGKIKISPEGTLHRKPFLSTPTGADPVARPRLRLYSPKRPRKSRNTRVVSARGSLSKCKSPESRGGVPAWKELGSHAPHSQRRWPPAPNQRSRRVCDGVRPAP